MNPGFILTLSIFIQLILSGLLKLLFPGFIYSDIYSYVQVPLSTIMSIMIPSYISLKRNNKSFSTDLVSDVKTDIMIPVSIAIGVCTQFAGIALNIPFNLLLNLLNGNTVSKIPTSNNILSLGISIICFALIPAVCEEILFRGIVLRYFRRYGNKAAIIISALLFAIMHLSFDNFIAPLFMGIIFGMIFIFTNRLIYPMLAHLAVNTTACVITFANKYETLADFYNDYFWIFVVVSFLALYGLMKFFKTNSVPKDYADMDIINTTKETVYNIDEYNLIKIYEHDVKENNLFLAFKELLSSPYFYILFIIFVYLGGSVLW